MNDCGDGSMALRMTESHWIMCFKAELLGVGTVSPQRGYDGKKTGSRSCVPPPAPASSFNIPCGGGQGGAVVRAAWTKLILPTALSHQQGLPVSVLLPSYGREIGIKGHDTGRRNRPECYAWTSSLHSTVGHGSCCPEKLSLAQGWGRAGKC